MLHAGRATRRRPLGALLSWLVPAAPIVQVDRCNAFPELQVRKQRVHGWRGEAGRG
jgi:hypothetical protein